MSGVSKIGGNELYSKISPIANEYMNDGCIITQFFYEGHSETNAINCFPYILLTQVSKK